MKSAPYAGTPLHISTAANAIVETWAGSALPPPEPQGQRERSRPATCSLPVALVEDVATLMTDCAPQVTQWQAQWLVALAAELRAHAAAASKRQPAENAKDEPRP